MSIKRSKSVGELNGWYAFLFKIMLHAFPLLIAWFVWATPNIILNTDARVKGPRFTETDWERGKAQILEYHRADMENHVKELIAMIKDSK